MKEGSTITGFSCSFFVIFMLLPSVKSDDIFEISQDEQASTINVQLTLANPYTLLSSSDRRAKKFLTANPHFTTPA
jgi:hypothetical protein